MTDSSYPLIHIEDALNTVRRQVRPLTTHVLRFSETLGTVLAEDVVASEPLPPFPAAIVDGYAVLAADGAGWRTVVGDQMAGEMTGVAVTSGMAARVTTGASIPSGADAMVMIEQAEEAEGQVNIKTSTIKVGDNIRPVGIDIAVGQKVLRHGTLLGPAELGLLATVGKTRIKVYTKPVVAVMSTGDELVEPFDTPLAGQIRDSNRYTLKNMLRQMNVKVIDLGIVLDRPGHLEDTIQRGLREADVLLTSGGVSMGQRDLVKPYLEAHGKVHFGRVNIKPGKPITFATVDGTHCFALPGNPVSAMVCFEIFVRPALQRMAGHIEFERPTQIAMLAHDFKHSADRTEFQRVVLRRKENGMLMAHSTGTQSSSRLLSMLGANGLVILPHGQGNFVEGSVVETILLDIV